MGIFERKDLPLTAAPLYYLALIDLAEKHLSRLQGRIAKDEVEAANYLNLFRGESVGFHKAVVDHVDLQAKSQQATSAKQAARKEAVAWIGLVRKSVKTAGRRIEKARKAELSRALHVGREFSRSSAGEVLLEARYLSVVLPDWKSVLSPPLHESEIDRAASVTSDLENAVFGKISATADQLGAAFAKSSVWSVLEDKSKYLLEAARLEFSKDPTHPDYPIRVEFEGLDEKFAPRVVASPVVPTPPQPV